MNDPLGVHMMMGEMLLAMLQRVEAGEKADDVYMEMYASADHVSVNDLFFDEGDE